MKRHIAPVPETKRLVWVDAARGFAIFGIFIVNIGAFSSPYFMYGDAREVWTSNMDQFVLNGIDIFIQASFYTLFSLLFGFGLGMMKDRSQARGHRVYAFLMRRMTVLLGFGIIHGLFLWHGDILFSYALVGMVTLFFLQMSDKLKIGIAAVLLGGSVSLITFFYFLARDFLYYVDEVAIKNSFQNYLSEHLRLIWTQNVVDWQYANHPLQLLFLTSILLPLFLIGMIVAEKRWLHEPERYKPMIVRGWIISLVLFLTLKMGPYAFGNPLWFSYAQDNLGGMFSAIFYILSIVLLAETRIGRRIITPFTYVGRMALTNYILQSIISFFLFYGVGFGLYGSISPTISVVIVTLVFLCQIAWSKWWFRMFRFGPFEWIWRCLTYLKIQPFKK